MGKGLMQATGLVGRDSIHLHPLPCGRKLSRRWDAGASDSLLSFSSLLSPQQLYHLLCDLGQVPSYC